MQQWLAQPDWPAGPVWFLWVLLVFNCAAAAIYRFAPKPVEIAGRLATAAFRFPVGFFHTLVGISALAYIPLSLQVSPVAWSTFGPFTFQTARILHYAAYFLIGMIVGSYAIDKGLLASGGKLARNWRRWAAVCACCFPDRRTIIVIVITAKAGQPGWSALASFMFVLSCAASSFAVTAIFVHFFASAHLAMWDSLANNAYGIYLVHYVFVNWLQYSLLNVSIPGLAKGVLVTLLGLALELGGGRRTAKDSGSRQAHLSSTCARFGASAPGERGRRISVGDATCKGRSGSGKQRETDGLRRNASAGVFKFGRSVANFVPLMFAASVSLTISARKAPNVAHKLAASNRYSTTLFGCLQLVNAEARQFTLFPLATREIRHLESLV